MALVQRTKPGNICVELYEESKSGDRSYSTPESSPNAEEIRTIIITRAYQLTRTLLYPTRAETVESTSSTVDDGGRERLWSVCEPKPVSADQIHSTDGTESPRAHETASSTVCGRWVHMAAGISARNRAAMEKSYLLLKVESLCGATGYPVRTPRLKDTVLDAHTRKPITVITERYLVVLRFCSWSQPGHNQKLAHFIAEIRLER